MTPESYIKIYVDREHNPGDFWLTEAQAEICDGKMESCTVDIYALLTRAKERKQADTRDIFDRIFRGSMPAIVSGGNSNSQISKRESNHRTVSGFSFAVDFYYMNLISKGIFKMKVIFSVFLYFIQCLICPGEEIPYTVSRCRNLVKTALGQCYIILSIRI